MKRWWPFTAALLLFAHGGGPSPATYGADPQRTGWYPDEPQLTPALVGGPGFGRSFKAAVDGQVYAQPLVSSGVLLVATEQNNLYGLDPATGAQLWSRNLGPAFNPDDLGSPACQALRPAIGVTGTPVIDDAAGAAYLVSKTYVSASPAFLLHGIDLHSGNELPHFPVTIAGTAQNDSAMVFDPLHQHQRAGLLLQGGVVYAAFGGLCDLAPFQGWVAGISTATGAVTALWVARSGSSAASGNGISMSGSGLASDGPGAILLSTGSGFGAGSPSFPASAPPADLGQSVVRLAIQPDGSLRATDFFSPYDAAQLDANGYALGAGGPVVIPSGMFGASNLLALASGQGYLYLLDRGSLGGFRQGRGGGDNAVFRTGPGQGYATRPAVWPGDGGWLYLAPTGSELSFFHVAASATPGLDLLALAQDFVGDGSSPAAVSSNGTQSGSALVWMVWLPDTSGADAQLRAYDAVPSNGTPRLRFEAPVGTGSPFAPPAIAGGRVYVATRDNAVLGFGPASQPLSATPPLLLAASLGKSQVQTETFVAHATVALSGVSSSNPAFVPGPPSRAGTPLQLPATLAAGDSFTVDVTFTPSRGGIQSATLLSATSAGTWLSAVTGFGVASGPQLRVAPPSLSLGGAVVGESVSAPLTITNLGSADLIVGSVTPPDAPFSVANALAAGTVLHPFASLTASVTYSPTQAGESVSALVIHSPGGDAQVPLTGIASTTASRPPAVALSAPAAGATLAGTATISAQATAGDAPLTSLALLADDASLASASASPLSFSWDTTAVPNGPHLLRAVARDSTGATAAASAGVIVKNPVLIAISPADGATVAGTVTATAAATPPLGLTVQQLVLSIDGAAAAVASGGSASVTWTPANGAHSISAVATASDGSTWTSQVSHVNVANLPTAAISAPGPLATVSGTVNVVCNGAPAAGATLAAVSLRIDGLPVASLSSSPLAFAWDTTPATNGPHVLTAVTTDADGATVTSPPLTVTVWNGPRLVLGVPSSPASGSVPLSVAATGAAGTALSLVRLTMDGALLGSSHDGAVTASWNSTTASNGAHEVRADALDADGSTATTTATLLVRNLPAVSFSPPAGGTITGSAMLGATATAPAGTAVVQLALSIDGAQVATGAPMVAWSWSTLDVPNGPHTISATAIDADGGATTASGIVTVANEFSLSLSTRDVQSLVAGSFPHDLSIDTSAIGAPEAISFSIAGLPPGVDFSFTPPVVMAGGNSILKLVASPDAPHAAVAPFTINATSASVPGGHSISGRLSVALQPQVSFSAPAAGKVSGRVHIAAAATADDGGIARFDLLDNGKVLTSVKDAISFDWDTRSVSNGQHALVAAVHDAAGNIATRSLQLDVENDFSLALSNSSVSLAIGKPVQLTIATSDLGGAETLLLSVDGLPDHVSGDLSPAEVQAGQSATLTVTASAGFQQSTFQVSATSTSVPDGHAVTGTVLTIAQPSHGCASFEGAWAALGLLALLPRRRRQLPR